MVIDPALYNKYPKEEIDKAVELLTYKKAEKSTLPKEESDIFPTLYIFRHGESQDNEQFLFSGWRDAELTDKGREQAQTLAKLLRNKKIDLLISSPQKRAVETMKIAVSQNEVAKELQINTDKRIMERSYGDLQGKSKLEIQLENPEKLKIYRRSFDQAPPNGESLKQVCERVAQFCDEIVPLMKAHKINVAVSCHGNSIRGFRRYFEKLSDEETRSVETPLAQDYLAYTIK